MTDKSIQEKFWAKVEKTDGCWIWKGGKNSNGYGVFSIYTKYLTLPSERKYLNISAHRYAYLITHGSFDQHLSILHTCDVRNCVNPEHIRIGTTADNVLDMHAKGRAYQQQKTHCPRGHEYTDANTKYVSSKDGISRQCKICRRISDRQYYVKKRQQSGHELNNLLSRPRDSKEKCPYGHEYSLRKTKREIEKVCKTCSKQSQKVYREKMIGARSKTK